MKSIAFLFCLLFSLGLIAQSAESIEVWVHSKGEGIPFASLVLSTGEGFSADEFGNIRFECAIDLNANVSAIGFQTAQFSITPKTKRSYNIELKTMDFELDPVVITGISSPSTLSASPVATRVIPASQLQVMPGASLVQSLSQSNGISEVVACSVCGTNEIRLNGMEGVYTLVLIDGIPMMGGLAAVYGLNGIPASLIEQVEVITGPASTQYGSEAMGGVINIITKKAHKHLHGSVMNSFSTHQELNSNFNLRLPLSANNSLVLGGDLTKNWMKLDENGDNFTDIPLNDQRSAFVKWSNEKGAFRANISGRIYHEDRQAGVLDWSTQDIGSSETYGEYIETRRSELFGNARWKSWSAEYAYSSHFQDSYYGDMHFRAKQNNAFSNFIKNFDLQKTKFNLGFSQRMQWYEDNSLVEQPKFQFIPGIFVQGQRSFGEKMEVLSGLRLDHHRDHGVVYSPRMNVKFSPKKGPSWRLNAGTGFRLVNLFTEDHAALSGSRIVEVREELRPEASWHLGLHMNHFISTPEAFIKLESNVFYTSFSNRIVPNYDIDPNLIVYENANESAESYGLSGNLSFNRKSLQLDLGATYSINTSGGAASQVDLLFSPNWSANGQLTYSSGQWRLDVQTMFTGAMPLPDFGSDAPGTNRSDPFFQHHVKCSWQFNEQWAASIAVRNLGNWTQESPIIAADQPFSDEFDTNFAYGPIQTRRFIFGLSYVIGTEP